MAATEALPRVGFADAIADPQLLLVPWRKLSLPQQVALKAVYGLPLEGRELTIWSAFQGAGIYDELGYLLGVTHQVAYKAMEYLILTCIWGRRSGKSSAIAAFSAAYEITLGGHTQRVALNQELFWLYIAQDLGTAQLNMKFILSVLADSPLLRKQVINPEKPGIEECKFKNGITLRGEPPNIKTARGSAVCGVTMDEIGFWYKDAKSANPDFEVERAVAPAMGQFFPFAKQLRFSTPWTKEGLLYEANQGGTLGWKLRCSHCINLPSCDHLQDERDKFESHLVLGGPTALMENPFITRKFLAMARRRDPEAFIREYLATFIDSQTSFLTHASVDKAVQLEESQLTPGTPGVRRKIGFIEGANYVIAIDPAFRKDGFTLSVGHSDTEYGFVQDEVRQWEPLPGERVNPAIVLDEIKFICDYWQTNTLYSDQAQLESLQQLAIDRDMTIFGVDFTVKSKSVIMNSLANQANMNRLKLLNEPTQALQLKQLQKVIGPNNYISIGAPSGKHDDYATVLALCIHQAMRLPGLEREDREKATPSTNRAQREANLQVLRDKWATDIATDDDLRNQAEHLEYLLALTADDETGPFKPRASE